MKNKFRRFIAYLLVLMLMSSDMMVLAEGVIKTLTLPAALQIIDEEAFCGNTSIEKVVVPDGTTEIRSRAFADSSLTEIELPDTLTFIADDTFEGCGEFKVIVPTNCYAYNWCLANGLLDVPVEAPASDFTYNEYESYVEITGYSGEGGNIAIPEKINGKPVRKIGNRTFYSCESLQRITIPDSITEIGEYAFYYCDALESVDFSENLISIGKNAFANCDNLMNVDLPISVRTIGDDAFYYCTALKNVVIPEGVSSVGQYAFAYCESLTNVALPDSVNSIGKNAFYYCKSITDVELPANLETIESSTFNNCYKLNSIVLPEKLRVISGSAFSGCSSLKNIIISEGTTTIGSNAFYGCSSLQEVVLPDTVTVMENSVFYHCYGLKKVVLSKNLTEIDVAAFAGCTGLTEIVIYNKVSAIQYNAFSGCTNLKSVTIPASVETFGTTIFANCSTDLVIYGVTGSKAEEYAEEYGIAFVAIKPAELPAPTSVIAEAKSDESIQVNWDEVAGATGYNIYRSTSATGIYSKVYTITSGSMLNYTDTGLASNTFYYYKVSAFDANGESMLSSYAFTKTNTLSVTSVTLNKTNLSMKVGEFATLTAVINPSNASNKSLNWTTSASAVAVVNENGVITAKGVGTATIKATATDGSGKYTSCIVTVSQNAVTQDAYFTYEIRNNTYARITKYVGTDVHVVVPAEIGGYPVNTISGSAFADTNVISVFVSEGIKEIGSWAFDGCSALTTVYLPDSLNSLGSCAFYECSSLISVNIPAKLSRIEGRTFMECSSLKNIALPNGVSYIGERAFFGCSSMERINLPEVVNTIESRAFYECGNLVATVIKDSYAHTWCEANSVKYVINGSESTLPVPENVTASAQSSDSIRISWDKVNDAEGYYIYRSTSSSGTYSMVGVVSSGSTLNWTNIRLAANTTYYYKVSAYNGNAESAQSNCVFAKTSEEVVVPPACDHSDTSRVQIGQTFYNQLDGNDEKHQVEKHYEVACIACGEILDDDLEELTTEDHTFDQDEKCTVCGYEKNCSHTWTLDCGEFSCEMIIGNEQQHETISVSWKECRSCGVVVGEKTEVRQYEDHSFDERGWCGYCGYQMNDQPACDHSDTSRLQMGQTFYNQIEGDDEKHQVEKHYSVICDTCGETIDSDLEELTTEDHSFDQAGLCTKCQYQMEIECDHTDTSRIQVGNPIYKQVVGDDEIHQIITYYVEQCDFCREIVKDGISETTSEMHTFDAGGVCEICGYEKCLHTETIKEYVKTTYAQISGNTVQHQVTNYYKLVCDNCGEATNTNHTENLKGNHTFDNENKCTLCGYVKPQEVVELVKPVIIHPDLSDDSQDFPDDFDFPAYSEDDMTILWGKVDGAVKYTVQVEEYEEEDWDDIINENDAEAVTIEERFIIPGDKLYEGGLFRVLVKAYDADEAYKSSGWYYFRVGSPNFIGVSDEEMNMDYEEDSNYIDVCTSQNWRAIISDSSWITLMDYRGKNEISSGFATYESLRVEVTENEDYFPRIGTITFRNDSGRTAVVTVVQEGNGSANEGKLKITTPTSGDTVEYDWFDVKWTDYNNTTEYYTVELLNVTTDRVMYFQDMTLDKKQRIYEDDLDEGHSYRITVTAYNYMDVEVDQAIIVIRVEGEYSDEDYDDDEVIETPEVPEGSTKLELTGITNNSKVDLKNITVTWNEIIGKDYYAVAMRDITPGGNNQLVIDTTTQNLEYTILSSKLVYGHKYRLWVGAYKNGITDAITGVQVEFTVENVPLKWTVGLSGASTLNVSVLEGAPDANTSYLFIAEDSAGLHYFNTIPAGTRSIAFTVNELGMLRAAQYDLYVLPVGITLTDANRSQYFIDDIVIPLFNGNMISAIRSGKDDVTNEKTVYVGDSVEIDWEGSRGVYNAEVKVTLNGEPIFSKTYTDPTLIDRGNPIMTVIPSSVLSEAQDGDKLNVVVTVTPETSEAQSLLTNAGHPKSVSSSWEGTYGDADDETDQGELSVYETAILIGANGGGGDPIYVDCNALWTAVTDSPDWITLIVDTVNGQLHYLIASNEKTEERIAIITVSAEGCDPIDIKVVQDAKHSWDDLVEGDGVIVAGPGLANKYEMCYNFNKKDTSIYAPAPDTLTYTSDEVAGKFIMLWGVYPTGDVKPHGWQWRYEFRVDDPDNIIELDKHSMKADFTGAIGTAKVSLYDIIDQYNPKRLCSTTIVVNPPKNSDYKVQISYVNDEGYTEFFTAPRDGNEVKIESSQDVIPVTLYVYNGNEDVSYSHSRGDADVGKMYVNYSAYSGYANYQGVSRTCDIKRKDNNTSEVEFAFHIKGAWGADYEVASVKITVTREQAYKDRYSLWTSRMQRNGNDTNATIKTNASATTATIEFFAYDGLRNDYEGIAWHIGDLLVFGDFELYMNGSRQGGTVELTPGVYNFELKYRGVVVDKVILQVIANPLSSLPKSYGNNGISFKIEQSCVWVSEDYDYIVAHDMNSAWKDGNPYALNVSIAPSHILLLTSQDAQIFAEFLSAASREKLVMAAEEYLKDNIGDFFDAGGNLLEGVSGADVIADLYGGTAEAMILAISPDTKPSGVVCDIVKDFLVDKIPYGDLVSAAIDLGALLGEVIEAYQNSALAKEIVKHAKGGNGTSIVWGYSVAVGKCICKVYTTTDWIGLNAWKDDGMYYSPKNRDGETLRGYIVTDRAFYLDVYSETMEQFLGG